MRLGPVVVDVDVMVRALRFVLVLAPLALVACGSAEERAAYPGAAAITAARAADSPFVPRSADALCGGSFRWTGDRCAASEEKPNPADKRAARKAEGGLVVDDMTVGRGREVRVGDMVKLHYTGTLTDGTVFDSSRSNGQPFEFRVGQGQVIKGFDRGVLGMKVGGRRRLTIPHQLGYGQDGSPPRIPPKATLIFDLDLLDVM